MTLWQLWTEFEALLPPSRRVNAAFLEARVFARSEDRKYRVCVQGVRPDFPYIDAYGPTPEEALRRIIMKMREWKEQGWGPYLTPSKQNRR